MIDQSRPGGAPEAGMWDVVCYYYDPVKVPLLRDAVLPAATSVSGPGLAAHVERHWRFGPHLRVRIAGPPARAAEVAGEVAGRLRRHLTAHPSTVAADREQLLAQARIAGREELVPPPYAPLRPDNTVRVEPADLAGLGTLLGSPEAVECRMRLLRLGGPALAGSAEYLCDRGNTPASRVQLALTAMALHAGRYPPGFGGGYQSFLSHLKEFLLHHDRTGRLRARYAASWQRQADQVTGLVARLAAAGAGTAAGTATATATAAGTEQAWLDWTRAARAVAAPAHQRGELQRVPGYSYTDRARQLGDPDVARRWDPDRRTEFSDYHQLLRLADLENFPYLEHFVPYRFSTSVLYLLLGVLDVRPVERYLAAYLLSEAAERITGLTWRQRLEQRLAYEGRPVPSRAEAS